MKQISRQLAKQIIMFAFSILYFIKQTLTSNCKEQSIRKILVIDLMGIGDVVCLTPFLNRLKESERFEVWGCFPYSYKDLMANMVAIDGIIGHSSYLHTIKAIRKESFDLIIIPGWALRHSIVALLSCRRILGYITSFATSYIPSFKYQAVGLKIDPQVLDMKDLHLARRSDVILDSLGLEPISIDYIQRGETDNSIIIHAGADFEGRRWPTKNFSLFIDNLISELGMIPNQIKLIGGPQDKQLNQEILKYCRYNVKDLAGKMNLKETQELISKSKLFIGNDSGPMHIAWVSGVRTIALMGPNLPSISGPLGDKNIVHFNKEQCCPCDQTNCPYNYKCINSISVENVAKSVSTLLEK